MSFTKILSRNLLNTTRGLIYIFPKGKKWQGTGGWFRLTLKVILRAEGPVIGETSRPLLLKGAVGGTSSESV